MSSDESGRKVTRPSQLAFSEAKATLSAVVDNAVRGHEPVLIERNRGKESVLVVSSKDLSEALHEPYSSMFGTEVFIENGSYAVALESFGLQGTGASLEEALDDLVEAVSGYAARYFRDLAFYRRTPNRSGHYLPLLLFRAADEQGRRALLREPASAPIAV